MPKRITVVGLGVLVLGLLISCAVDTGSKVVAPITGSPMTPEWSEYNRLAEVKGAPLLMYAVTAKEVSQQEPREPRGVQDTFSLDDDHVYVYTKWANVREKPKYQAKIYDPRGSVFYEYEREYQFGSASWNVWVSLHIKGGPAARLPGKWRAEIFMDGSLAAKKEFIIGSAIHHYPLRVIRADAPTIGVHPYFLDAEISTRNHSTQLPLYISQMLTVDFDTHRIVMPFHLKNELSKPVAKFDDYGSTIREDLQSSDSQLNRVIQKYNLDLLITGAVFDTATYGQQKWATLYFVNPKTRDIKEIKTAYISRPAYDRTDVSENFYQEVYSQILKQGGDTLRLDRR